MGISIVVYTLYGLKLPYKIFNDEFYEMNDFHKKENFTIIPDFMTGRYTIIGKILFKTHDFRMYDENDYTGDVEIDLSKLDEYEREYRQLFLNTFPNHYDLIPKTKFNILCFTHYY